MGNVFIITRFACWIKVILDYLLKICYNLFVRPSKVLAFQAFIILTSLAVDTLKYYFLYDSKNASCTRFKVRKIYDNVKLIGNELYITTDGK